MNTSGTQPHSCVSTSIPDSLTIPSPVFPLGTIRLLQSFEQSSLGCPAGPCWFSMLNTAVCPRPSQTPWLSLPPGNHKLSLWICFCFVRKFICVIPFYNTFHIQGMPYDISPFLSDLPHSVWESPGPPMLLQMALFYLCFWKLCVNLCPQNAALKNTGGTTIFLRSVSHD